MPPSGMLWGVGEDPLKAFILLMIALLAIALALHRPVACVRQRIRGDGRHDFKSDVRFRGEADRCGGFAERAQ